MKRILLSLVAICAAINVNAQADTLTEFFTGTPALYAAGEGYVCGNNNYGDLAKYQRFDASTGITGAGTITGVLVWVGAKTDAGGSFEVNVVDFAGGAMGTVLGSETMTVASIDTTLAGFGVAEGTVAYNVAVTFATPIPFTAASDLAIGVVLPTTAGDTLGLISNTDGDFALAATHAFELWSDGTVAYMGDPANWDLASAMGIFPVVDFALGLTESTISAKVYPNPASTVLNVNTSGVATSVSILSLDGKVISNTLMNSTSTVVDVADLTAGVYFYEIVAEDGSVVRNTFVKK